MSGLAGLLAGRDTPGVWRWDSRMDPADVRDAVQGAGWVFGHVDGLLAQGRAEFLTAVGESLSFPEYYGRNFDALADCLDDLPGAGAAGVVLLWDTWGVLAHEDRRSFDTAVAVLAERASRGAPFAALLRGDGPEDVLLPLLD